MNLLKGIFCVKDLYLFFHFFIEQILIQCLVYIKYFSNHWGYNKIKIPEHVLFTFYWEMDSYQVNYIECQVTSGMEANEAGKGDGSMPWRGTGFLLLLFFGHTTQLVISEFPSAGIQPVPSAIKTERPNHWTARNSHKLLFRYNSQERVHWINTCWRWGTKPSDI